MNRATLLVALAACSSHVADMPACAVEDRVIDAYTACRAAKPPGASAFRAEDLVAYKRDVIATRGKNGSDYPHTVHRICAFHVDHIRTDAAGEGCAIPLTEAERQTIATVRADITAPLAGSTAEATHVLAEHARERDRACACRDATCVNAAKHDAESLRVEVLQPESDAVHDNFDRIGVEAFDCETRPEIIDPERWAKVK